jgi:hypothetical protein
MLDILICIMLAPFALIMALGVVSVCVYTAVGVFLFPLALILDILGFDKSADKIIGWLG